MDWDEDWRVRMVILEVGKERVRVVRMTEPSVPVAPARAIWWKGMVACC